MRLRPRREQDLPPLLRLLQAHHEREGYPVRPEAVSTWWLAGEGELAATVAEQDGRLLGHVALHPATPEPWERAAGRPADRLAVVTRLFTDRSVPGTGTALLDHAVRQARAAGRAPVLLVDPDSAARGWYGRRGWTEVGTDRQTWGPRTVDAVLLVAPEDRVDADPGAGRD